MKTDFRTEMLLVLFELNSSMDFTKYHDSRKGIYISTRVAKHFGKDDCSTIVVTLQWHTSSIVKLADNNYEGFVSTIRDLIDHAVKEWPIFL